MKTAVLLLAIGSVLAPFSLTAAAQVAPLVIAWQAPVGPDAEYGKDPTECDNITVPCLNCPLMSTHFDCFVSNVLPNVSGVGFVIPWGEIDQCAIARGDNAPCELDSACNATNNTCFSWAWVDQALMDFITADVGSGKTWANGCAGGQPCKIVLIVWLTQDSGNVNLFNNVPNTPAYVFSQTYANSTIAGGSGCNPTCAPQDVVVCQEWTGTNGGLVGGWNFAAPITDSCWPSMGSGEYGLWNVNGAFPLHTVSGCTMNVNPGSGFQNFSGYPVMYEMPMLTAAENFIKALALHYSSACTFSSCTTGSGAKMISSATIAPSIAYMRIGPSSGGEDYPYCSSSAPIVYTNSCSIPGSYWSGPKGYMAEPQCFSDQGYLTAWPMNNDGPGYISSLYQNISQQNWAFPITTPSHTGPPNNTSVAYADSEALLASQNGLGMGMQAASIGDLLTYASQYSPSSTANWAVHFRQFPNVPVHHLQSMNPGSPMQAAQFTISTISSSGLVTCGGSSSDCSVFCTAPPWVFISGTSNPALNGLWQVENTQFSTSHPLGCTTGTVQLVGTFPRALSSSGVIYSGAHLPVLLPFESQNCQGSLQTICSAELWEESLDWTYGTNTVSGAIGNTGFGDLTYQNAINNFLIGLPSSTSVHSNMTSTAWQY